MTAEKLGPATGAWVVEAGGGYDPKAEAGSKKVPLRLIPPAAMREEAWAFELGSRKYGAFNWRLEGRKPRASVYYEAVLRHVTAWYDGEDVDPESGRSHLAHARAGLGILLDAMDRGRLEDDRPPR